MTETTFQLPDDDDDYDAEPDDGDDTLLDESEGEDDDGKVDS